MASNSLGNSFNLFEMLFERMPMGIAVLNREYRILRYNPTWEDFSTRYAPPGGAPLTPGVGYFDHIPGAEATILPLFEQTLAGETVRQNNVLLQAGKLTTYWDVVLTPLVENDEITGILVVSTDVTERVLLRQNLEQRVAERTHELARRKEAAESLRDILSVLNSERPPREIFAYLTRRSAQLLNADASILYRVNGAKITHEAEYNFPEALSTLKPNQIYPGEANQRLQNQQIVAISEARTYLDQLLANAALDDTQRRWYSAIRANYQSYVGVPLIVRSQFFGGLILYFKNQRSFSEEDLQLGQTLGEQAALAIENARLRQEEQNRRQESERRRRVAESMREIVATINASRSLPETLTFIAVQAKQMLESQACLLHHIEAARDFVSIEASDGLPEDLREISGFPLYSSPKADQQILNREPVWVADFQKIPPPTKAQLADLHPDVRAWRDLTHQYYRAWLAVPLVVADQIYGSLAFYFAEPREFDAEEINLSQSFAEQAALAIENARLYQAEQARQRELKILLDVASAANSSLDLDEILSQTLDLIVALVGASRAGTILLDQNTGELTPHILRPEHIVEPDDIGKMLQAGRAVIASGEMLYIPPDRSQGLHEPGALLPIQTRGRVLGVLGIIGPSGGKFTPAQLALFKSIADQLGVSIDNAHLYEAAEESAVTAERNRLARDLHDAVTQTLFSASMIADVLPKIWERNPGEGQRRLEELRQLTRGALSEMRTLLVELRPAALVDTDLGDLLGHQVNAFTARTRLPVAYERHCEQNPPPEIKEMFYRVAQETFNNIAKHAEATSVKVQLDSRPQQTQLTIQDDGCGFDLNVAASEGLGLGIMAERARNMGAQLEIDSQIGTGTILQLSWQNPKNCTNE